MTLIEFPTLRVREFTDARQFQMEVGSWLTVREAENCYILGDLGELVVTMSRPGPKPRMLALFSGNQLSSVALLYPDGTLMITWCTLEMVEAWINGLAEARCQVGRVFAPAYTANKFSERWAQRMRLTRDLGQAERIYQLALITHTPLPGQLQLAQPSDAALLLPWFESFSQETDFKVFGPQLALTRDELIERRQLYLWKDPAPRAMAAWVRPTPHGGSINFVFVPPAHRGQGLGKTVTASLAQKMLASGLQFCFILTGATDQRNNRLYQSIGARTVAELVLWKLHQSTLQAAAPPGWQFSFPKSP